MKYLKKTMVARVAHALAFELLALALFAPLGAWLLGLPVAHVGVLSVAISAIAMAWNVVFNAWFERVERRFGLVRNVAVRVAHACAFEFGLVVLAVPLAAWWLDIGLVDALLLDFGFLLLFLPYTFGFNAVYDRLRAHWVARRAIA
ncbi:multidrug/biocide efflux PACE transporter [Burkholderia guangdongensis]|uniref:multidrug/biocide efflux PACE transporter n=1 Tax=Burkholderia guangdongensis TaxID=1792500 RepID=UPI0015C89D30|nr:multidrug/biocide efflux PACE transporter [Burkholderia guangdongensis]